MATMRQAIYVPLLLVIITSSGLTQDEKTGTKTAQCDDSLWKFVYHPSRLPAKNDCRVLSGTIKNFVAEGDGDYHIRFMPDDKSLVNAKNHSEQGGALVVEPVCQNPPTQSDAKVPCKGYSGPKFSMSAFCPGAANTPPAPPPGRHGKTYICENPPRVRITGFYTIDNDHGWMELHTVNKIELLDSNEK